MKLKNILLIGLLVILSLLYTWYEANRPQPVDWSETYSPEDKIPYGTYIVHHSLLRLFPQSEIITSRLSVTEELDRFQAEHQGVYIFVSPLFDADPVQVTRLLDWVEGGNNLFIAAETIADTLLEVLSLKVEDVYGKDTTRFIFPDFSRKEYTFPTLTSGYFIRGDGFRGTILGVRSHNGQPDFLQLPYGDGQIWLNLNPRAFTNRWVLDTVNGDYYYKALSWIPDQKQTLIWDAYQTMGRLGEQTPLRVILRYPALRVALYLLLACGLLYVFFKAKREQRPIPVVRLPENKMLEFIAMVSSLYYRQSEHSAIALKQIDFFLGEVRRRYYLPTDRLDDHFILLLSERSGVAAEETKELITLILKIKADPRVTPEMLCQLMKGTDLYINISYR